MLKMQTVLQGWNDLNNSFENYILLTFKTAAFAGSSLLLCASELVCLFLFLADDCCGCPWWSTAPSCSGTQQTSCLLLKDPAVIFFHHHINWLSWMMLHLPQEQKPQNLKESHPVVVDTYFKHSSQCCSIRGFWSWVDPSAPGRGFLPKSHPLLLPLLKRAC